MISVTSRSNSISPVTHSESPPVFMQKTTGETKNQTCLLAHSASDGDTTPLIPLHPREEPSKLHHTYSNINIYTRHTITDHRPQILFQSWHTVDWICVYFLVPNYLLRSWSGKTGCKFRILIKMLIYSKFFIYLDGRNELKIWIQDYLASFKCAPPMIK